MRNPRVLRLLPSGSVWEVSQAGVIALAMLFSNINSGLLTQFYLQRAGPCKIP